MSKLSAFLKPTVTELTKEVIISKRFIDENGNPVPVTIKTITQEENNRLIERSTKHQKSKGQVYDSLNKTEYQSRLVVACVANPDFADSTICSAYGTTDPLDVPARMFLSGEFSTLTSAIMELNGFKDTEELEEESKNF